MIHNYIPEALQILNSVQDSVFVDRPIYLHPYTMLTALLIYAPTETAKQEIAKDIIDITANDGTTAGLIKLTDYWWTTLLIPCNILYSFSLFTNDESACSRRENSATLRPSVTDWKFSTAYDNWPA